MTCTSKPTLADVWAGLDIVQKMSIQDQLDQVLADLRPLPHPDGMLLGGAHGEGCEDVRRHLHRSTELIMTVKRLSRTFCIPLFALLFLPSLLTGSVSPAFHPRSWKFNVSLHMVIYNQIISLWDQEMATSSALLVL